MGYTVPSGGGNGIQVYESAAVQIAAMIMSGPPSKVPGYLTIDEFSDLVLSASFNGNVCRPRDMETDPALKEIKPCRNPVPVTGSIVKAFAGSRLPGYHMVTEPTDGTEIFREAAERGMAGLFTPPEPGEEEPGSPEPGQPNPGGSSAGETLDVCTCTCEERSDAMRRGEKIKSGGDAGEDVNMGELMGLMRCSTPCRSEYIMCAMEEAKSQGTGRRRASQA